MHPQHVSLQIVASFAILMTGITSILVQTLTFFLFMSVLSVSFQIVASFAIFVANITDISLHEKA